MLTGFGIGKGYTAVFFSGSEIVKRKVKIEKRPVYYASAAKFESESLGLTVKELTYEALRYFQMDKKDPGVIISKIELGSKTDVAGVKCFEIITHVNGKPVSGLKSFEGAVKKLSDELRLTVKRMTKSRVVRINLKNGN
jgi:S1-C subfamily serine protease